MNRNAALRPDIRTLAFACFFLSGATGLTYEVVWTRLLGNLIGNTHFSITLVVSVFMGGLAIGSWLGGRAADRSPNPLRLYGVLVLLVGVACLLVPVLIAAARPLLGWLYRFHDGTPEAPILLAARIAIASLVLVVPTSLMGATLPALTRALARRFDRVGGTVGALYAVNTFGAVTGAAFAGFVGVQTLGIHGSIALAVVIDLAIGVAVIVAAREKPGAATIGPRERLERTQTDVFAAPAVDPNAGGRARRGDGASRLPANARLAVVAFGVVGFANMLLQIAWTKALVLSIGNSTYAFSLIVSLFILGIALGGGAIAPFVDRMRNPLLALGMLVVATAGLVSATIPFLGYLPIIAARVFNSIETPSYGRFLAAHLGMVAAVILPSTVLMGTVFPIVGRIRTQAIETVGTAIGSAYFWNTAGSILGTLAAGFLFVPWFGRVYYTLYLGAFLSLAVGTVLILGSLRSPAPVRLAIASAVVLAVALPAFLTRPNGVLGSTSTLWHPAIMSKGAYAYYNESTLDSRGQPMSAGDYARGLIASNEVLYYTEGTHAAVAVVKHPTKGTAMRISGKVEASTSADGGYNNDAPHQILAGHLPMILHPKPEDVLTLGLGGGVTLGTLTLYPVRSVDSLEISPEVIEAARRFFAKANRGALDNPLVRDVVGDGRNHLEYTTRAYDVITSVPSNPWIAGIGNLFTVEFFETCRDRLAPGGIICNWIHKINMRSQDFRTVLRTFVRVFPDHAQLWDLGYDALLIAGRGPIRFDATRLRGLLANPEIARDLASLGITGPETFLRGYTLDAESMRRYAGDGPVNTDSFPVLEFSCPYGLYGHQYDAFGSLARAERPELSTEWIAAAPREIEVAKDLREAFVQCQIAEARDHELKARIAALRAAGFVGQNREVLDRFLELAKGLGSAGEILRRRPDPWLSRRGVETAAEALGVRARPTLRATVAAGYLELAKNAQDATSKVDFLVKASGHLGDVPADIQRFTVELLELRAAQAGVPPLRARLTESPDNVDLAHNLAVLLAASGKLPESVSTFEKALGLAPDAARRSVILQDLGFALEQGGNGQDALKEYDRALAEDPKNETARARAEALRQRLGQ